MGHFLGIRKVCNGSKQTARATHRSRPRTSSAGPEALPTRDAGTCRFWRCFRGHVTGTRNADNFIRYPLMLAVGPAARPSTKVLYLTIKAPLACRQELLAHRRMTL